MDRYWGLQITYADHRNNQFLTLGGESPFIERADVASCYVVCNDCSARTGAHNPQNSYQCKVEDRRNLESGSIAAVEAWNARPAANIRPDPERDALVEAARRVIPMVMAAPQNYSDASGNEDTRDAALAALRAALATEERKA